MKFLTKHVLVILVIFVVGVVGSFFLLYHHFFDYEFSTLLLKESVLSVSKTASPSQLSPIHHVFIIVEENHDLRTVLKSASAPFLHSLLLSGGYATNYRNVPLSYGALHPSNPNYILLEAGRIAFSDHTFTTDNPPSAKNSTSSQNHITALLTQQNLTWRTYQEDISGTDCPIVSQENYVPKHNPFIYFQDVSGNPPGSKTVNCVSHMRPLSDLSGDLSAGAAASYTFITPNLIHDMHNGTIAQADVWLSQIVPEITNSSPYKKDGALFITWDESEGSPEENNPIGMIVISPFAKKGFVSSAEYSHASYVKTVEEIFHLNPLLGMAADPSVHDLSSFFR